MQQLTLQFDGYAPIGQAKTQGTAKQCNKISEIPIQGIGHSHVGNKTFPRWEQNIPTLGISRRCLKLRDLSVGWALRQVNPSAALSHVVANVKLYAQGALCVAFGFGMMFLAALIGG